MQLQPKELRVQTWRPWLILLIYPLDGVLSLHWDALIIQPEGGHLVLCQWDLKLVIEFPPGSTILIPSVSLYHSNTAIQLGERRYLFTQYTSGGLFRWVDQGFQKSADYLAAAEQHVDDQKRMDERWNMGVGLFSTLNWLQQHPSFNKAE